VNVRYLHAAAVLLIGLAALGHAQNMMPAQRQALNAAERWLVPVDEQRYADAWAMAADSFKGSVNREQFRDGIRKIRNDYGRVVTRTGEKMAFVGEPPNANDPEAPPKEGTQVAIMFDTKFAGEKQAAEQVTMVLEKDGLWRVAGYYIR
jgi:Protein of unknown function (DUF4019)